MELKQLKYFTEICRYRSFALAATKCFISAQGINVAIIRLENELDRQLFIRDKRGVILTPAAEYLLPIAQKIVVLAETAELYFSTNATHRSILPLACAPGSIEEFAGNFIVEFQSRYPNINISVLEYTDEEVETAIISGEIESGFASGPFSSNILRSRLVAESPYALIVHKDHPLSAQKSATVSDIKGVPVVVMNSQTKTYTSIRTACHKAGFEPSVSTFAQNILTVFDMAQFKQAIGIASVALYNHLKRPLLKAIPFHDPDCQWEMYYITRKDVKLSPPAKIFDKAICQSSSQQHNPC